MNRIDILARTPEKKLVIYLMAGDPDLAATEKLIYMLADSGVSLIELGIPFSDPVADGPVIQRAGERALKKNITLKAVMKLVKKARKKVSIPVVFMTYYNLIYSYGVKKFAADAARCGVDGVIVPDLPFDEENEFYKACIESRFYPVYLVSPTNTGLRIKKIVAKSKGFVYYILLKGVTGARKKVSADVKILKKVKKLAKIPVFAGFGISNPAQAGSVLRHCDGVIIGSAFVSIAEKYGKNRKLMLKKAEQFIKSFVKEGVYG